MTVPSIISRFAIDILTDYHFFVSRLGRPWKRTVVPHAVGRAAEDPSSGRRSLKACDLGIRRAWIPACGFLLLLYIVSYCVLSSLGEYWFDSSGRVRYGFGMAASDIEMWHPRGLWYQVDFLDVDGRSVSRGNVLGYFYSPLILLDRALIHKTRVIISP